MNNFVRQLHTASDAKSFYFYYIHFLLFVYFIRWSLFQFVIKLVSLSLSLIFLFRFNPGSYNINEDDCDIEAGF